MAAELVRYWGLFPPSGWVMATADPNGSYGGPVFGLSSWLWVLPHQVVAHCPSSPPPQPIFWGSRTKWVTVNKTKRNGNLEATEICHGGFHHVVLQSVELASIIHQKIAGRLVGGVKMTLHKDFVCQAFVETNQNSISIM